MDSPTSEPRFDLGDPVRQKFLGAGRVSERQCRNGTYFYKVEFASGPCHWIPECDLKEEAKA